MFKESDLTLAVRTRYTSNFKKRLQEEFPKLRIIVCNSDEELISAVPEADILFIRSDPSMGFLLKGLFKNAPKLKWIQITEAGADALFPSLAALNHKVEVTCMRGTHGDIISEYYICAILMLLRDFPRYLKNQEERIWEQRRADTLRGKTVLILGLGQIGRVLAKRLSLFEAHIIGMKKGNEKVDYVDQQVSPRQLMEVLPAADFVCVTLPLTDETRGLIKEKEIQAMKKTAYLINTARGEIVDTEALIRALKGKWIAGVIADVFAIEPLPADSELWNLPNLILTPHIAGALSEEGYVQRRVEIFSENLRGFLEGKEMINRVDLTLGF